MGWDDNGLPTERRVQNYFGVRCDPSLAVRARLRRRARSSAADDEPVSVSRPNFIELCERLTAEDEKAFEALFRLARPLGRLAADLHDDRRALATELAARVPALLERGLAYQLEAPTMWDVDFQSAVAQAEIEDREIEGRVPPDPVRPRRRRRRGRDRDLAPRADPARASPLVVNPADERYAALVGRTAVTPLFQVEVPIVAHELAEPEKGTGAAMICTFGDITDVTWWRELKLPARVVVQRDGTIAPPRWGEDGWQSRDVAAATAAQSELAGMPTKRARKRVAELLAESGDLLGEPKPVRHPVKFYERGERPLEVVSSRQWFVKTIEFREQLLELGRKLSWHPPHMGARYASWVEGLNGDWAVSRQRFFGVSFPVWYRLDDDGVPDHEHPIVPDESRLPVDPSSDAPDGFTEDQRGKPGGFVGDPDVMDTWATSSLHAARSPGTTRRATACSSASSRWTCVRRRTRSSEPGSSTRC